MSGIVSHLLALWLGAILAVFTLAMFHVGKGSGE